MERYPLSSRLFITYSQIDFILGEIFKYPSCSSRKSIKVFSSIIKSKGEVVSSSELYLDEGVEYVTSNIGFFKASFSIKSFRLDEDI